MAFVPVVVPPPAVPVPPVLPTGVVALLEPAPSPVKDELVSPKPANSPALVWKAGRVEYAPNGDSANELVSEETFVVNCVWNDPKFCCRPAVTL